ncbi:MAG TPA: hypothetical protein PLE12_09055 [Propionicimonas sp.]|nr:hypothetical protein [Propionicimonas sp.]
MTDPEQAPRGAEPQPTIPMVPDAGYGNFSGPWNEPTAVDPFAPLPGQGYSNPVLAPTQPLPQPQAPARAEPGPPQRFEQPPPYSGWPQEPPGPVASLPAVFPGAPVTAPYAQPLPEHPYAVITLVLGVLGFFTGITAPVAWILGAVGGRQVRHAPGRWRSGGMMTVGMVLGIIVTVGSALIFALIVLGIVLFAAGG